MKDYLLTNAINVICRQYGGNYDELFFICNQVTSLRLNDQYESVQECIDQLLGFIEVVEYIQSNI